MHNKDMWIKFSLLSRLSSSTCMQVRIDMQGLFVHQAKSSACMEISGEFSWTTDDLFLALHQDQTKESAIKTSAFLKGN